MHLDIILTISVQFLYKKSRVQMMTSLTTACRGWYCHLDTWDTGSCQIRWIHGVITTSCKGRSSVVVDGYTCLKFNYGFVHKFLEISQKFLWKMMSFSCDQINKIFKVNCLIIWRGYLSIEGKDFGGKFKFQITIVKMTERLPTKKL